MGAQLPALRLVLAQAAEELAAVPRGVPDSDVNKITFENAMRR
ncbi:hypothetical protein [Actinomadura sp. CNU-125]|nr:hypothetical protein [Actinomadura sp. CNU-125]